jgi:signal transduction histidine kinase
MLKRWLKIYAFMVLSFSAHAQKPNVDSLVHEANITRNDTLRLIRLNTITRIYAELNPDSAYRYSTASLALAQKLHLKFEEGFALKEMGYAYLNKGNYPQSLQTLLSALAILENPKTEQGILVGKFPGDDDMMYRTASPHLQRLSTIAITEQSLGVLYSNLSDYEKAWYHHLLARQKAVESGNIVVESIVNLTMNRVYLNLKKNDSALISIKKSYEQEMQCGYKKFLGSILLNMGRTYAALGEVLLANEYYKRSLPACAEQGYSRGIVASDLLLGDYYMGIDRKDSAFLYINDGLATAQGLNVPELLLRSYKALSRYYHSTHNNDSTVKYQALIIKINDSLFNAKQMQQFQNIDFNEQQRQQQIETAKKEFRDKLRMYSLLAGLVVIFVIAMLMWRNSRQRKKANLLLSKQKTELESTLLRLKETQKQLIHSEKMASLGELTAGIAHEIQNPLNFVNNFSEVNNELIEEMNTETDITEIKAIANDIKQNNEKISSHGKRADAIVKGMLQHSKASTGKKEPTDINALYDEYLRLSYHGFRAKDKSFNATLQTDFDSTLGKINVVPQDIGRVLLNLFNNAFYSVMQKKKELNENYEPTVSVCTKKFDGKVEIHVKDNGVGIPQKVMDKIFQPFFTTKPTGQGTGLGLSLAYDIVKAHGGEIRVESKEGEGTEFIVQLPI